MIGKISAQPQCLRSPQTVATTRPPTRIARRIVDRAAPGSGTYIRPSAQRAASNRPSSTSSSSAPMRAVRTQLRPSSAQLRAVRSTMFCDRSVASTSPDRPTAAAIARVTRPLPHAASSTRSPGLRAAAASSVACAAASGSRQPSS